MVVCGGEKPPPGRGEWTLARVDVLDVAPQPRRWRRGGRTSVSSAFLLSPSPSWRLWLLTLLLTAPVAAAEQEGELSGAAIAGIATAAVLAFGLLSGWRNWYRSSDASRGCPCCPRPPPRSQSWPANVDPPRVGLARQLDLLARGRPPDRPSSADDGGLAELALQIAPLQPPPPTPVDGGPSPGQGDGEPEAAAAAPPPDELDGVGLAPEMVETGLAGALTPPSLDGPSVPSPFARYEQSTWDADFAGSIAAAAAAATPPQVPALAIAPPRDSAVAATSLDRQTSAMSLASRPCDSSRPQDGSRRQDS